MRIRKWPLVYEPSMSGKRYKMGVTNLCYRGNRYKLKDGIVSLNINSHVGHHSEMDEAEINEHILGVLMIHQYNLNKWLELFNWLQ